MGQAHHLCQHRLWPVYVAQDALGPAQIETVVREPDLEGVADVKTEGKGQARCTPAGLGDHGCIDIDSYHPAPGDHQLGETTLFMPKATADVQNPVPRRYRADIEHAPLHLLNQRAFVGAVEPAEDCLGTTRLACLLEALMQTAHRGPHLAGDRSSASPKHNTSHMSTGCGQTG